MIELARRRMMMGGSAKPYDAEVEYLKSTGKQYINTNLYANSNYSISCELTNVLRGESICMTEISGGELGFLQTAADNLRLKNGKTNTDIGGIVNGRRLVAEIIKSNAYIDGTRVATTSYVANCMGAKIELFSRHYLNGNRLYGKAIIHHFTIHDGGVLLIDMIPVRVGNVGYMYDKVSGQLFGNQGTGQFIIGPDKTV